MIDLATAEGFDWDDGNARKSLHNHGVSHAEAEQVFAGEPLLAFECQSVGVSASLAMVAAQQMPSGRWSRHCAKSPGVSLAVSMSKARYLRVPMRLIL